MNLGINLNIQNHATTNMRNPILLFAALFFAPLLASTSRAGIIRNVTINSVSSEYTNGTDLRTATNTINGCGLFGDSHTVAPQGCTWLTLPTTPGNYSNSFIVFDLGSVSTVDRMRVWNYNESTTLNARGIQQADIFTSTDGVNFTTNFPNTLFNKAPGTFASFAQTINLGGISARYVGFKVITNFNAAEPRVGLCKVLFYDTNVAPVVTFASRNFSNDRVTVLFSDHVSPASATNAANYSILLSGTNAATVSSAAFDFYPNRVVLQTSVLNSNFVYSVRATNITDTVTGVKVDATPVPIEAELALWLKADAGVTADGSGFVSQWNDQSGSGNHAVQTQAVNQPLLVAGAMNGKPVLRFDASVNINYLDIAHASNLVIRSDFSLFTVVNVQNLVNYNAFVTKTAGNQPGPFDIYTTPTAGKPTLLRGNGSANSGLAGVSNLVAGQAYILSGVARGTNMTAYLNGAFNGSVLATAGITDRGGVMKIGTRGDLFTKLTGDIAEIILIRGAVSDAERSAINNYLGAKYAIPVINLAITQQPTNTTRLEGQTATFFVGVAASSPTINYQWQRYGTNLPNATNATYTTPVLTQAENNSTYRAQVSVPGTPSQLSDTAILSVLADTEQPTVVSAGRIIWNPSQIVVAFSESMSPTTATVAGNYSLDNGGAVSTAAVGDTANKVVLNTTGLTNGGTYTLTVQNVKDSYNNTIVTTQVPLTVYPAAALWYSAGIGPVVDNDGYVTQWNDLSGNGNHATPTFGVPFTAQIFTNGFNGQTIARFDGVNSISLFAPSSPSLAIVGDISIYTVVSFVDFANFNSFVGKTQGNLPATYDFYTVGTSGEPRFYRGNGAAANAQVTATAAPSLGVPHVISVVMGGTSVAHFLDGQANGTGNLATILEDTGAGVGIGTRGDGFTKLKGDLAEVLIFGVALSTADRTALDNYFGAKYGISVGAPPSLSIANGTAATVVLRWPTPAQPFALESATNIVAATWAPVTNSVTSSGGTNSVTVDTTGGQQFYRLHKQ